MLMVIVSCEQRRRTSSNFYGSCGGLMRVLLCKIHCPFICFCKPSSQIYRSGPGPGPGRGPLKLENTPLEPLPLSVSEDAIAAANANANGNALNINEKEGTINNGCIAKSHHQIANPNPNPNQNVGGLKSILRISKSSPSPSSEPEPEAEAESQSQSQSQSQSDDLPTKKKKVQWLDSLGKELAQIREFESSEPEETEYEGITSRGCICSIL